MDTIGRACANIQGRLIIKKCSSFKSLILIAFILLGIIIPQRKLQAQIISGVDENISWQQKFDEKDRPTVLIDPAGRKTLFSYSEELSGKTIITKTNDEGEVVELEFEDRGLLSSMKDVIGNVNYQYDALDRLIQVQRTGEPTIKYEYDLNNRITNLTVGDFYNLSYTYDFMGRLSTINTPVGTINYEYQLGQRQVIRTLPNGVKTIWESGADGQHLKTSHLNSQNYALVEFQYQYRPDGLIDAIAEKTRQGEKVTFYKYDNVGRIIQVLEQPGNNYNYEYDLLGNRIRAISSDGRDQINTYDWASRLTSFNGNACTYDAAGNLSSIHFGDSKMNYKYSQDQQLANVNDKIFYKYGGDGEMVEREVNEEKTKFISNPLSDFWQPLVMKNDVSGNSLLIWDGNSPLIKITNGQAEYILHDHLGSARLIVDEKGAVKQEMDYSTFGTPKYEVDRNGLTIGFSGLFYDSQAEQYLTRARAYNPDLGQFMQIEPEQRVPTGSQKNLSLYVYCGHDPVNFVDIDGRAPRPTPYAWLYTKAFFTALPKTVSESWGAGMNFWGNVFRGGKIEFGAQPGSLADQAGRMGGVGYQRTVQALSGISIASSAYVGVSVLGTKLTAMGIQAGTKSEPFHIGLTQFIGRKILGKKVPQLFHYGINKFGPHIGLTLAGSKAALHLYETHTFLGPAKTGIVLPSYHYLLPMAYEATKVAIPMIKSIWQRTDDFIAKPAYGDEISPSNVGGVSLAGAGDALAGTGQIEGLSLDANNNLILIGKKGEQTDLPPMRIDDVVTVFRSVYIHGEGPNVTIDPNPKDPEHSAMIIGHGKATESTYVGWVLYHADRLMKAYMLGVDNITTKDVTSKIPGYEEVLKSIYFGDGILNTEKYEGKWERFWIVPAQVNQFSTNNDDLTLFDVPLKLKTQVMKWEDGKLVDDSEGKSSLGARNYTEWFTKNYDAIAKEQYLMPPPELGIKDPVPVFAELQRIAVMTALAEKMREQGVPMPFWMRDYEVRPVQFEKYTPALLVTRTDPNTRTRARIFGGVSLSVNSKEVKQFKTTADLKQLPKDKRIQGAQTLKVANTLSATIQEYNAQAIAPHQNIIDIEKESYQTIPFPGAETKALSPCTIDEVDMMVTISGGRNIHLPRHFNSFFNPKEGWGQTWTMNLPRLEIIKVPTNRSANTVSYHTAYELITPLNSIYVRFSEIERVPALHAQLQVPDAECEFFGLANATPNFLTTPTLKLIGKTGESWHFTEYGDLIAIEKDGFRIVYLRNQTGNVSQIVGVLGRTQMASIDLEYDQLNRLTSATGKNEFGEAQTVTYEYNSTGDLSGVISTLGKLTYNYENRWVSETGWQDIADLGGDQNPDEITLHRFEYNKKGQLIAKYDAHEKRTDYSLVSNQGNTTLNIHRHENDSGVSSITYDASFRPLELHNIDGTRATWRYPELGGSAIEIIDNDGKKTHITESADKTERTIKGENQPTVTQIFDPMDRLVDLNIDEKNLLRQQWSVSGKLQTIETENSVIRPQYNEDGLTESITLFPPGSGDQIEKWETINFDLVGRPVKINDHSGLHMAIQYDNKGAVSQFITVRDDGNYGYEFSRNENGQIETVKSSWGNNQFTYDSTGILSKLIINKTAFDRDAQATVEFKSGRVHKIAQFDGGQMEISYYNEGLYSDLISQIKSPNGLVLNYRYNSSGDLDKINVGNERQVRFDYDDKGRIISYSFCKN